MQNKSKLSKLQNQGFLVERKYLEFNLVKDFKRLNGIINT